MTFPSFFGEKSNMVYKIVRSDELYHHGILGQKWGTRNGPPYPLDASDHSAAEKKAGWKKSLGGGSSFRTRRLEKASAANKRDVNDLRSKGYNKEADAVSKVGEKINSKLAASKEKDAKRSELINNIDKKKLKKAAIIGGTIAAAGLATYGAYKVAKLGENAIHEKGQNAVLKMENAKAKWISDVVSTTNKLSDTTGGYIHDHFEFRNKDGSLDRISTKYANIILGEYNQDIANLKAQARYRDRTARTSEKISIGKNIIKDRVGSKLSSIGESAKIKASDSKLKILKKIDDAARNAGEKLTAEQREKLASAYIAANLAVVNPKNR